MIDRTGLTGKYDFVVKLAENVVDLKQALDQRAEDRDLTTYARALSALGLKLASRKDSMQILVVDHAERVPSEN